MDIAIKIKDLTKCYKIYNRKLQVQVEHFGKVEQ